MENKDFNYHIENAIDYYDNNKSHIDNLIKDTSLIYYKPSYEELHNPKIWKTNHWKWFVKTYVKKDDDIETTNIITKIKNLLKL